ncbi:MAG: SPOR domain-containing protein [Methylomonas sp.]|jgi:cell division protein FtsN
MSRDYKHRAENNRYQRSGQRKNSPKQLWRWLLVAVLAIAFLAFLKLVGQMAFALLSGKQESVVQTQESNATQQVQKPSPSKQEQKNPVISQEPGEPQYDFYTILPHTETVIPDYEIKTRVREELVGKTKSAKYTMQAGSFHEAAEADQHKAKLALLGIESHVETAKVGNLIWHRVKIGPYDNPSSVSKIKDLLKKNGIEVVVTETGQ